MLSKYRDIWSNRYVSGRCSLPASLVSERLQRFMCQMQVYATDNHQFWMRCINYRKVNWALHSTKNWKIREACRVWTTRHKLLSKIQCKLYARTCPDVGMELGQWNYAILLKSPLMDLASVLDISTMCAQHMFKITNPHQQKTKANQELFYLASVAQYEYFNFV